MMILALPVPVAKTADALVMSTPVLANTVVPLAVTDSPSTVYVVPGVALVTTEAGMVLDALLVDVP